MKVVVAGGSGYVGRHLVSALVADDHDVVVLSRTPGRARRLLPAGVQVVGWQPASLDLTFAAPLANAEAVFNLCGASVGRWPWTAGTRRAIRSSRLGATTVLVDAISSLPVTDRPRALVNASGIDLYDGLDAEPATESVGSGDTFLGRLCLDWEAAARGAEDLGVRVVMARFSLVFGPGAPLLSRLALPVRLGIGGRYGSGEQWVSWVGLADAIRLLTRAAFSWDICGPLNVGAPGPIRQRELATVLGRVLRRPTLVRTPAWLLRLALGGQSTLLLGSRRAWPAKALAASFEFEQTDLEQVLRESLS